MVGLGLALARPDRRIAVITGDGDVLMALGSLATIGVKQPKNLSIVCLDNAHYSASGMQPSATKSGVDLGGAAHLMLPPGGAASGREHRGVRGDAVPCQVSVLRS